LKYAFITDHRHEFPVMVMCQALDVSPSGYYAWRRRPPSQRQQANEALVEKIKTVHKENRSTYGSPRITRALQAEGQVCSQNRVARLMKTHGICAKMGKVFKRTTQSDPSAWASPNLLAQDFHAFFLNQTWVSDITYIRTGEGWLYLCIIMDLFSRQIIGWAMESYLTKALVQQAFDMACHRSQPGRGVIFHSDRGSQYTSKKFRAQLEKKGFIQSMSGTGNCYDNAMAESFFHTLKTEEVYFQLYATRTQARASIFEYIEIFYNRTRRHSALDYLSPVEFVRKWAA
jgi:putative transposase